MTWTTTKTVADAFVPVGEHMVRLSLIESFYERDDNGVWSNGNRKKSVVVRVVTGREYVADGVTRERFGELLRNAYVPTP